jgi:hypothetical protein
MPEEMVKVVGVAEQCKASGVRIKKGKTAEVTMRDARLLEAVGAVEFADKKDKPKTKGLTAESVLKAK